MIQPLKAFLLALCNYGLDCYDYLLHSATLRPRKDQATFRARLTKKYHSIEKGLALPSPRPGFGRAKVLELTVELERYLRRYSLDETAAVTLSVLEAYQSFNESRSAADKEFEVCLRKLRLCAETQGCLLIRGGIREVTQAEIAEAASIDFRNFAMQRYSVRAFGKDPVDLDDIQGAVSIAQKSPSVCNRQPWKVHVYHRPDTIKKVLAHQNGNRGFGEYGSVLLVVTSQLSVFEGTGERNEAYVDGGMFSMSLVYALHSLGLGSCCLNLCQQNYQARRTKCAAGISDEEVLIMMILVGTLPDKLKVARSHRRDLGEVIVFHDPVSDPSSDQRRSKVLQTATVTEALR